MLAALTGIAGETGGLLLGSGVLPLPARSPHCSRRPARRCKTVRTGGSILGIGTGSGGAGSPRSAPGNRRDAPRRLRGRDGHDARGRAVPARPRPREPAADLAVGAGAAGAAAGGRGGRRRAAELVPAGAGGAGARGRAPRPRPPPAATRRACASPSTCARASARTTRPPTSRCGRPPPSTPLPGVRASVRRRRAGGRDRRRRAAHAEGRPEDVPRALAPRRHASAGPGSRRRPPEEYRYAGADLPVVYPVVVRPRPRGLADGDDPGARPRRGSQPCAR